MTKNLFVPAGILAVVLIAAYIALRPALSDKEERIVVFGEDSSNLKAYSLLADDFKAKTGVVVAFEGATFEQSVQKADADFRNGTSLYDIVLQYNFSLAPYVRNKYIADINDVFSPSVLKSSHINEN